MSEKKETVIAKKDENSVEFVPFGGSDKLRLTASMIKQFIAVPTKSGALPSERDCIRFIMLCRGKRANPFEGDCFLIGYDSQLGPSFSMVCGIELFLKRASAEPSYDGNESGVIVSALGNEIIERPGTMVMDGEKLIGGWAKVYRKDRKQVEYKSVKFETYDTGRSRWMKDPGGQIAKVALSQALRSAYPTALGALYTQEEMQRVTEAGDGVIETRATVSMPKELPESLKEKSDHDFELAGPKDAPPPEPQNEPPAEEHLGNPNQPAELPGDEEERITVPRSKRFYAIWKSSGRGDDEMRAYIFSKIGSTHTKDIPTRLYNEMCEYAGKSAE